MLQLEASTGKMFFAVVEKLMSSSKLTRILLLQLLFAYCFSGAADLGWERVLRTPPPLLL